MKKVYLVALGALLLASCGGHGTEVSKEEFKAKADAIEAHSYAGASVHLETVTTGYASVGDEKKDLGSNVKADMEFTYDEEGDPVLVKQEGLDEETITQATQALGMTIKEYLVVYGENEGVKFYTGPLGLEYSTRQESEDKKNLLEASAYIAFNDYGFVTKMEGTTTIKMEAELMGVVTKTDTKATVSLTINYK